MRFWGEGSFLVTHELLLPIVLGIVMLALAVALGCIEAARTLHADLLANNLRSPMSFFDTTPLGRILNRFSKDVDTVDADLRMYIQNWMSTVSPVIATIIIIIYSTPIFIVVVIPLGILFFILQVHDTNSMWGGGLHTDPYEIIKKAGVIWGI